MLDLIELQLDREGIKEREDGKWAEGGGGKERLLEGGDNRGTAIIQENTVQDKNAKFIINNNISIFAYFPCTEVTE